MKALLAALTILWAGAATAQTANAFIVQDLSGEVLLQRNADDQRPIASITKLFTAKAAEKLDPNELITIEKSDIQQGRMRSTPLKAGQSYTRQQLIELALVSSDNVAAIALGRAAPFSDTPHAVLVEASGLDAANQSSARQLAAAARELYNTDLAAISTHTHATVGNRKSTNPLLTQSGWTFYLSKTGFINSSGGCLVVITQMAGRVVTVVILGASNTRQRWKDLAELRRQLGDTDFSEPVAAKKRRKV